MADYPSTTSENKCVFCEIAKRNISTPGIFWEDDKFMAFLSTWPNCEGNTVVIPKTHFGSDVLAMRDTDLQEFILASKKVAKILESYFEDVGRVGVIMEGTGIDHAHIKLYPMHGTDYLKKGEWKQCHSTNSTFFDTYAGYLSSNDGPKGDEGKIVSLAQQLLAFSTK
jgi:histidine triad (HIT) family protein